MIDIVGYDVVLVRKWNLGDPSFDGLLLEGLNGWKVSIFYIRRGGVRND